MNRRQWLNKLIVAPAAAVVAVAAVKAAESKPKVFTKWAHRTNATDWHFLDAKKHVPSCGRSIDFVWFDGGGVWELSAAQKERFERVSKHMMVTGVPDA